MTFAERLTLELQQIQNFDNAVQNKLEVLNDTIKSVKLEDLVLDTDTKTVKAHKRMVLKSITKAIDSFKGVLNKHIKTDVPENQLSIEDMEVSE